MASTVSDFLFERLGAWGIKRIFGYPGDGINGLMGAFARIESWMDFVQVRHEEQAAYSATAHAKFTGASGVCLATSGPGAIHLLNELYDAKGDHMPVIAIVGQAATSAMGTSDQQEVDLNVLFKDVASAYCQTVTSALVIRHVVDRAVRIAKSTRSVTCIIIPKDVQELDAVEKLPRRANLSHRSRRTGRYGAVGKNGLGWNVSRAQIRPRRRLAQRMRCLDHGAISYCARG